MISAFTTKYNSLVKKLVTEVVIKYDTKEICVSALWDTGANLSCISEDVVSSLSLISSGYKDIRTPSGESTRGTYKVNVILPNNVAIDNLEVADSEISNQGIGMLIGMDIIGRGDFVVSNYNGTTIFSFRIPSASGIDFVKGLQIADVIGQSHRNRKHNKK